jgi:hypothetical protein
MRSSPLRVPLPCDASDLHAVDLIQEPSRGGVLSDVEAGASARPDDLFLSLEGFGDMDRKRAAASDRLEAATTPPIGVPSDDFNSGWVFDGLLLLFFLCRQPLVEMVSGDITVRRKGTSLNAISLRRKSFVGCELDCC